MQLITRTVCFLLMTILVFVLFPPVSQAYIGPGLGLGLIGEAIGVLFAFFLAVFAVVWHLIKKVIRHLRKTKA